MPHYLTCDLNFDLNQDFCFFSILTPLVPQQTTSLRVLSNENWLISSIKTYKFCLDASVKSNQTFNQNSGRLDKISILQKKLIKLNDKKTANSGEGNNLYFIDCFHGNNYIKWYESNLASINHNFLKYIKLFYHFLE